MSNNSKIQTINPATGKTISSCDITPIDQIGNIAKNARNAFERWRGLDAAIIFET